MEGELSPISEIRYGSIQHFTSLTAAPPPETACREEKDPPAPAGSGAAAEPPLLPVGATVSNCRAGGTCGRSGRAGVGPRVIAISYYRTVG